MHLRYVNGTCKSQYYHYILINTENFWESYLKIERYINWIYENICYTYMYITNIYGMLLVHVKLTYMICLYLL